MPYENLGRYQQRQREIEARGKIPGWAEPLATLGSGLASSALGGLAALGTVPANLLGLSKSSPADVLASIQREYTYAPRSLEGQAALHAIGTVAEKIHEPVAWAADKTLAATGSPALATVVDVAPTALGAFAGLPSGPVSGAARAARAAIPNTAPSRAGLGPGIRGQQGVIANAMLIPEFEPAAKRALRMAAAGQGMQTIWDKTQVWAPTREGPNPPRDQPLVEIAPPDDALSTFRMPPAKGWPGPSPEQVARAMQQVDELRYARELSALLHEQKIPLPQALALLKAKGIELPWELQFKARTHGPQRLDRDIASSIEEIQTSLYDTPEDWTPPSDALGGLIQHPLFGLSTPAPLSNLGVIFRGAKDKEVGGGFYSPMTRQITGYTNRGMDAPGQRSLLEHETTHALAYDLGEPSGTSPKGAHNLLNSTRLRGGVSSPQYNILRELSPKALYAANEGEALARLAQKRLQYDAAQRAKRPLALDVDLPLSMLWGSR